MSSEGTELVQCPFDPHHMIMRKRFQVHLNRCRKNHKTSDKVVCPFNATHYFSPKELESHVLVCPERAAFERFKHAESEREPLPPVVEPKIPIDDGENWSDDCDAPTYNPSVYAANNAVLRLKQNAPPSEKKLFRQQERLRLMNLNKN